VRAADMGNTVVKGTENSALAFEYHDIPDDALVYKIWIYSCRKLKCEHKHCSPYVSLRMSAENEMVASNPHQEQHTSHHKDESEPRWRPPESFLFWMPENTNLKKTKLMLTVENYAVADHPMSMITFKLDDERIRDQKADGSVGSWEDIQEFPLLSCATGREDGSSIRLVIGKAGKSLAFARRQDILFEYERKNVHGWGHTAPGGVLRNEGVAHFLPTDKVRHWGSADGTITSNEFDEVADKVPVLAGYVVAEPGWHFSVNNSGDDEGWTYGLNFVSDFENARDGPAQLCRRRMWVRTSQMTDPSAAAAVAAKIASGAPPPPAGGAPRSSAVSSKGGLGLFSMCRCADE